MGIFAGYWLGWNVVYRLWVRQNGGEWIAMQEASGSRESSHLLVAGSIITITVTVKRVLEDDLWSLLCLLLPFLPGGCWLEVGGYLLLLLLALGSSPLFAARERKGQITCSKSSIVVATWLMAVAFSHQRGVTWTSLAFSPLPAPTCANCTGKTLAEAPLSKTHPIMAPSSTKVLLQNASLKWPFAPASHSLPWLNSEKSEEEQEEKKRREERENRLMAKDSGIRRSHRTHLGCHSWSFMYSSTKKSLSCFFLHVTWQRGFVTITLCILLALSSFVCLVLQFLGKYIFPNRAQFLNVWEVKAEKTAQINLSGIQLTSPPLFTFCLVSRRI